MSQITKQTCTSKLAQSDSTEAITSHRNGFTQHSKTPATGNWTIQGLYM